MTLIYTFSGACVFEEIPTSECPSNPDLPECTSFMAPGTLCEADERLPNGHSFFDVDNCGGYDVFRCRQGTKPIIDFTSLYQLSFDLRGI